MSTKNQSSFVSVMIKKIMLLISLIIGIFLIYQLNKSYQKNSKQQFNTLNEYVSFISSEINAKVSSLSDDIKFISKTPPILGMIRAQDNRGLDPVEKSTLDTWKNRLSKIFHSMIEQKSQYFKIAYIDTTNNDQELLAVARLGNSIIRIRDEDLNKNVTKDYHLKAKKMAANNVYLSDLNINQNIQDGYNELMIFAGTPIYHNNENRGVLIIEMFGKSILKEDSSILQNRNLRVHVFDSVQSPLIFNGSFQFDRQFQSNISEKLKNFLNNDRISSSPSTYKIDDLFYSVKKTYYNPSNPKQFITVSASKDSKRVNELLYSHILEDFTVLFLLVLFGFILAFKFAISLGQPIHDLKKISVQIAAGDKVDLDEYRKKSTKEFYDLAKTIQKLTGELSQNSKLLEQQKNALDVIAMVSETDTHGRIIYANNKFAKISQYTLFELLDKDHRILNSDYHDKEFYRLMWNQISSGDTWHGIFKNRKKNGEIYWVDCYIVPFKNEFGIIQKYISISTDITNQKEKEEKLKELSIKIQTLNTRFKIAMKASQVGVFDWDTTNKSLYWDQNMHALYETDSSTFGKTYEDWMKLLHPEDRSQIKSTIETSIQNSSAFDTSFRIICPDDKIKTIRSFADFSLDENQAMRMVGVNWDISKDVEKTNQLEILKEKAESASLEKSKFLSNMSHEIRTPMNAIIGMTELMKETNVDKMQSKYLDTLENASEGLLILINDILDMAKIEAGQIEIDNKAFDLEESLNRVCEILRSVAFSKNTEIAVRYINDTEYHTIGDEHRFRQIMTNLISNAIKFTTDGSEVLVEAGLRIEDNTLYVSVKDKGIGIEPDKLDVIFESFSQANAGISSEFGGTGLGLPISQQLANLMGGNITVESELGVGSCFTLTLPYIKAEIAKKKTPSNFKNLDGKSFLVVDDRDFNRQILKETLEQWGAKVLENNSGLECIETIKKLNKGKQSFDAIICDNNMPELNGIDVLEKFHHELQSPKNSKIPFIISTSNLNTGDLKRARKYGVESILWKPLKRSDLWDVLAKTFSKNLQHKNDTHVNLVEESSSLDFSVKILVAEDQEEKRFLMKQYLTKEPVHLDFAANGNLAVEKYKNNTYDLIFMDIKMPIKNGLEATREIRELEQEKNLPRVPIIALSAYAIKDEIEKTIEAGCDQHLTKPIRKKAIIEAIFEVGKNIKPSKEPAIKKDFSVLDDVVKVDEELEPQITNFLSKRKKDLTNLKKYLKQLNYEQISSIGHNLAGIAPAFGFEKLGDLGRDLENYAKIKDSESIKEKISMISEHLKVVKIKYVKK